MPTIICPETGVGVILLREATLPIMVKLDPGATEFRLLNVRPIARGFSREANLSAPVGEKPAKRVT